MYPYLEIFNKHIPTYGICLLLGIALVFILSMKSANKYNYFYYDLFIFGGFVLLFALPAGSFLYVIVTYNLKEIIDYIMLGDFSKFAGLVFYGSLIGGICGAIIGTYVAKLDLLIVEKIIIPYIPIGHAIGRIGCLLAGCCYGMEYTGPFAVYYKNSIAGAQPKIGYFPVQILEAIINIGICLFLIYIQKKVKLKFELLSTYIILYGILRFFIEFLRGDIGRGIYYVLSTSQWISLVMILTGSLYILFAKIATKKHEEI